MATMTVNGLNLFFRHFRLKGSATLRLLISKSIAFVYFSIVTAESSTTLKMNNLLFRLLVTSIFAFQRNGCG